MSWKQNKASRCLLERQVRDRCERSVQSEPVLEVLKDGMYSLDG